MLCSLVFNSNLICKYIQEYVLLQLSIWEIGTSNEGMLVQSVVDFECQDFVYWIRIEISKHLIFLMGWTTTGDLRLIYAFLIINLRIKSVGYVIYIHLCLFIHVCVHRIEKKQKARAKACYKPKFRRKGHLFDCIVSFLVYNNWSSQQSQILENRIIHKEINHRDAAFSLRDSLTALRSNGINLWFVTIIPDATSRNLPFEKSRGFPAASVTIPPASA